MLSPKEDKLSQIRKTVTSKGESIDLVTSIYYLIKELNCLPDIVGREYEIEYDDKGRISKIIQLPIKIPTLFILLDELAKDQKRQEREAKKMKRGRRR